MSRPLNINELAELAQCSVRHIHEEIKRGNLEASKLGRRLVFTEKEIEKWFKRKKVS